MNETLLRRVLQDVLIASLTGPFLIGAISCGGEATGTPSGPTDASPADAAPADASPSPDATRDTGPAGACTGQACTIGCGGSCLVSSCVNGVLECACGPCGPPPPVDAGPCHATSCGQVSLPAMCLDGVTPGDGGTLTQAQCLQLCGQASGSCTFNETTDSIDCNIGCPGGRRPAGMRAAPSARRAPPAGRYFARQAHLEAASVDAFRILRTELEAHGAPESLLADAVRAQEDEVRHARVTRALARRHGARVRATGHGARTSRRRAVRSLEAIAIENMVEGCVRETYGALSAMAQATGSRDARVRAVMAMIAPDETRHAALAWAVAEWARPRLDASAHARVDAATDAAIAELLREVGREPPSELGLVAGLPSAARARRMVTEMKRALWAHA